MSYSIRAVNAEHDAPRLTEIYNYYIENTTVTYEYDKLSVEDFHTRIENISKRFPYIVLEENGELIGYAYASEFNSRKAYQWDADLTIYLDVNHKGKGAGGFLFGKLLYILTEMGFLNAYSLIDIPNPGSEALHKKFGFSKTGEYNRSAWKFDKYLDMGIYSKSLSEAEKPGEIDRNWEKFI
ncbi:MAG: GNAT family N-acetyltransferase [Clostridia bacterium]|nr:GNAT family N-acetyltransferase [Clostridia bacterium]